MLLYRRHAFSSPNLTSGSPVAKGVEWRPKLQRLIRYTCFCRSLNHARNVEQIVVRSKTMGTEVHEKDILASQVRAGILRPAYAVLRDEKQKQIVLIVRGTHSMRDTLTCLTGASHPVPHHGFEETSSAGGSEAQLVLGYAHGGMLAGARWLFNEVREVLKTALQDNAGFDLRVVGHSLGGGVSVMLTMMLRELPDFREAECITFACPACLTLELARSCQHYVTTVINGEDVVPMVSTGALDDLRNEILSSSWQCLDPPGQELSSRVGAWMGGLRCLGRIEQRPRAHSRERGSQSQENAEDEARTGVQEEFASGEEAAQAEEAEDAELQEVEVLQTLASHLLKDEQRGEGPSDQDEEFGSELSASIRWDGEVDDVSPYRSPYESPARPRLVSTGSSSQHGSGGASSGSDFEGEGLPLNTGYSCTTASPAFSPMARIASAAGIAEYTRRRQLYPPGKILHLVPRQNSTEDNEGPRDENLETMSQCDCKRPHTKARRWLLHHHVPSEGYIKMRPSSTMVTDHFLPSYACSMKKAMAELHKD